MTPKLYEGTKRLHAQPMNRGEYNAYRGWENPADENPADDGYLVEYQDGGKANDQRHAGYISWSPKDVFERSYKEIPQSSFPPHQQRVMDEKRELDEKLQKLTAFISSEKFSTIVQDEAERLRLVCQEETMKDYSAILAERIEAFGAAPIALPVIDPDPDSLEREIHAKGDAAPRWAHGQAPRVTVEMVNEQIVGETYTVLPSGRVIVCELTLKNGFTVRGESAVVFIENNVPQAGREIARKKAADQIWQLLGYELRSKFAV